MKRSLLILLFAVTACAKQAAPEAAPEPEAAPAAAPVKARDAAPPHQSLINRMPEDGTLVKLIDAGAEPRKALRFTPAAGPAGTMRMVMDMGITMSMNDRAIPQVVIPPMVMDMAIAVDAVDEDGNIRFSAELVAVDLRAGEETPPDLRESLHADLSQMVGMRSLGVISDTGETLESSTVMPEGTPAELSAHMDNMDKALSGLAQPVPDEAVGVGAQWETLSRLPAGGMELVQQTVSEIIAWEGDQVTLRTTVVQSPIRMSMDVPEMPGVTASIQRFESEGSGESVLNLGALIPVRAESAMTTDLLLEMNVGDMSQQTGQYMTLSMTMEAL